MGILYGRPMERLAFHYDRHKEITRCTAIQMRHRYVLSSNGNAYVLRTFKIFGWFCYFRPHKSTANT